MGEIIGRQTPEQLLAEKLAWGARNRRLCPVKPDFEEFWENLGNDPEVSAEMPNLADGLYCEWPRA